MWKTPDRPKNSVQAILKWSPRRRIRLGRFLLHVILVLILVSVFSPLIPWDWQIGEIRVRYQLHRLTSPVRSFQVICGNLVMAWQEFLGGVETARYRKARQDCDRLAQAIQKYNSLEGVTVEKLMDLKGKYLTGIDTLKDPWRNTYQLDPVGGYVYSKGVDGKADPLNPHAAVNRDNVRVPYVGPLGILHASIEVNWAGETNPAWARDLLYLRFNKPFRVYGEEFDLNASSVGTAEGYLFPTDAERAGRSPDPAAGKYLFRWSRGNPFHCIDGSAILRRVSAEGRSGAVERDTGMIRNHGPWSVRSLEALGVTDPWGEPYYLDRGGSGVVSAGPDRKLDLLDPGSPVNLDNIRAGFPDGLNWFCFSSQTGEVLSDEHFDRYCSRDGQPPEIRDGGLYLSGEVNEIVIILPAGTSGSIIPDEDFINLTGNRRNRGGPSRQIFFELHEFIPAEMSYMPARIVVR